MKALRILPLAVALSAAVHAAAPVLDDLVPLDGTGFPARVEPRVPVGKALLFPVTASDADGDVLTYKVKSSSPNVLVRVRTGHPKLKLQINHAAGAAGDPAFTGTLEVAMFRDLTPISADFISGFAQSGYYNGQIFHRIANLDPAEQPDGSFIVQGGDPLGTGQGGPGMIDSDNDGDLDPATAFKFENEFRASNIFTGRGQLAMANAGTTPSTFRGTNGSQFFFTDGQPRFLDFNHTIMGQLLRGWDTLEAMTKVARGAGDKPTVDVQLQTAGIEFNPTDAILLITATAPGLATITVEASDGTSTPVTKTFTVTAFKDTRNSPPFLSPISNRTVAKETILNIPLQVTDLENDFVFFSNQVLSPVQGQSSGSGNPARVVGNPGYTGQLNLGVGATQYDMTYRGTIDGATRPVDDQKPVAIAVGDKKINARIESFSAAPGQALTDLVVASYRDNDPRGLPADFNATVNWGDGTPLSVSTGATPTVTIARDTTRPSPTAFEVKSSHTYANPGTYPLIVDLSATKGQRVTLRGIAVITAGPIRAFGDEFKVNGATLTNGVVASFTDDAPVAPAAYTATIQWGDGKKSTGTVRRRSTGGFEVLGSHIFPDPEDYSVAVRIDRLAAAPAFAWSRAEVGGFTGTPHLPPFDAPNLIGQMTASAISGTQVRPLRETEGNQTFGNMELIVINAGSKASPAAKIQFFLSEDKTLNRVAQGENPADVRVNVADLTEVDLASLQPGGGIRYVFINDGSTDSRLRFPAGENGAGLNLLAHFQYSDPIANHLPIAREVVFGPYDPFIVKPSTTLVVKEAGGEQISAKFRVRLARQPDANVTIPLSLSATDATQISISATSLVFTSANWNTFQEITVTAKDDNTVDGTKSARVTLGVADSTDVRFDNLDPTDVPVSVLDKTVTP
jgi:cyclophilin family peptidyl-prolyl cis-trans isomerase